MEDLIILTALALILLGAFFALVRRRRTKASCCGSAAYIAKSRKLKKVINTQTFRVEGMHCQNCVNRVMENIQAIPHTSASVNLKKGLVKVSLEEPVDTTQLRTAIEKGGYTIV